MLLHSVVLGYVHKQLTNWDCVIQLELLLLVYHLRNCIWNREWADRLTKMWGGGGKVMLHGL